MAIGITRSRLDGPSRDQVVCDRLLRTLDGLTIRAYETLVGGARTEAFRDHELVVKAMSRHVLRDLKLTFQLREGIAGYGERQKPAGSVIQFRRIGDQWIAKVSGGGSVQMGASVPAMRFSFEIDRLPPSRPLHMILRTALDEESFDEEVLGGSIAVGRMKLSLLPSMGDALDAYILGTFLYDEGGELAERSFLVPLTYNGRAISSGRVEEMADQQLIVSITM